MMRNYKNNGRGVLLPEIPELYRPKSVCDLIGADDYYTGITYGPTPPILIDNPYVVAGAIYLSGNSTDLITSNAFSAGPLGFADTTLNGSAVKALRCNIINVGSSGYPKVPAYVIGNSQGSDEFTIEVWSRFLGLPPSSNGGAAHNLINRIDPYNPNLGFSLAYGSAASNAMTVNFTHSTGGDYNTAVFIDAHSGFLPYNDFSSLRHTVVTVNSNSINLFENGKFLLTAPRGYIWDGNRDLKLGGNTYGPNGDYVTGANIDVFAWRMSRKCRWVSDFPMAPVPLTLT